MLEKPFAAAHLVTAVSQLLNAGTPSLRVAPLTHPFEACFTADPIHCLAFGSEAAGVFYLPIGIGDYDVPF
jgi:hypothetical protein